MNRLKSKTQSILQRPISDNIFSVIVIIVSAIMLITIIFANRWNEDIFCEITLGREILENGIIHTDTFRILPNMTIVVQQWLFDVIAALFAKLNSIGYILFACFNVGISFTTGYLYLSQYKIKFEYKLISLCLLIVMIQYPALPRAEAITVSLLILECYVFERYKNTKKWQWLIILPTGMILEANLHMSMIWFHFAIVLAYLVPSVFKKIYKTYKMPIKAPLLFTALMIPCMFINPYGINGVFYLPKSLIAGTFQYIEITEMQMGIHETVFLCIIAILIFFPTFYKKKKPYNYQVYMFFGFLILSFISVRNINFMYLAFLTITCSFLEYLTNKNLTPKFWLTGTLIATGILFSIRLGQEISLVAQDDFSTHIATAETVTRETKRLDSFVSDADIYMYQHSNIKTIKLFVGFNWGSYFEYMGYQNVYMDSQPEQRMKLFNSQRDELPEYQKYVCNNSYTKTEEFDTEIINEIQSWIQEYQFDYILIEKSTEWTLGIYMKNFDTQYHLVLESEEGLLYEQNSSVDSMPE